MKKFLVLSLLILAVGQVSFSADYTRGYFRSKGTYVNGYYKSSPNYTKMDNYSTRGNYNPYTGRQGTVNPYSYSNTYKSNYNSGRSYRFGY